MKGGLNHSDIITTVSNTYKEEIQTPFFGERLDNVLRMKREKLFGIMNGIDYSNLNPGTDKHIFENYDVKSVERKVVNKVRLQEQLKLPVDRDIPMIAVVSKLIRQKGMDLITNELERLLAMKVQLVVMGQGESNYEELFREYEKRYPEKLSVNIVIDDTLERRVYAASDFYLKPSIFEPCGVGHMIALRYGCIPIVRATGGLKDTVEAYNDSTGEGNGFTFEHYTPQHMLEAVKAALEQYKRDSLLQLRRNAMGGDYSWRKAALEYKRLYQNMI